MSILATPFSIFFEIGRLRRPIRDRTKFLYTADDVLRPSTGVPDHGVVSENYPPPRHYEGQFIL